MRSRSTGWRARSWATAHTRWFTRRSGTRRAWERPTPHIAVKDATAGLEGYGPKSGFPRILDLVLASPHAVAIDWVEGQIMGYGPHEVRHVALAAEAGLGQADPESVVVEGIDLATL